MEQWLPTIVSTTALGLLAYFLKATTSNLRLYTEAKVSEAKLEAAEVRRRVEANEKEYLTKENHDLLCSDKHTSIKLHINEVMRAQRKDIDNKFAELYRILDDLKDSVRRER